VAACPANAGDPPSCTCNTGLLGDLAWFNEAWRGQCYSRQSFAAVGAAASCAISVDTSLRCWGLNNFGYLGAGHVSAIRVSRPTLVTSTGVAKVAIGFRHMCSISVAHELRCWGLGTSGQLGIGRITGTDSTNIPSNVILTNVAQVSLGDYHTCSVTTAGNVQCWGLNANGQLGVGNTSSLSAPSGVILSGIAQLSLTATYSCSLSGTGDVRCWGNVPVLGNVTTPSAVLCTGATQLATGPNHICIVSNLGTVHCWGNGARGQLGTGNTTSLSSPSSAILSGIVQIALGLDFSCALSTVGNVRCWGRNEIPISLGSSTIASTMVTTPSDVILTGVSQLFAQGATIGVLFSNGMVRCWGTQVYYQTGQLGWGASDAANMLTPTATGIKDVSHGYSGFPSAVCALTAANTVHCWGSNARLQFGTLNAPMLQPSPTLGSPVLSGVAQVAVGKDSACALTLTGDVRCWGANTNGEVGTGTNSAQPTPSAAVLSNVAQISMTSQTICAVSTNGDLRCWGWNGCGQIGTGDRVSLNTPSRVILTGIIQVSVGIDHTCAVSNTTDLRCWGCGGNGQLGSGNTNSILSPLSVSPILTGIRHVVAGAGHTCVITATANGLSCFGFNGNGELGLGDAISLTSPVRIILFDIAQVALGAYHTCALTTGGEVRCWGGNEYGELGTGTAGGTSTRLLSPSGTVLSGIAKISAGGFTTFAISTNNVLTAWGRNNDGQLGNGQSASLATGPSIAF
jgi:alpha-tubulin suppressor-like RCC1 family protein